MTRSLKVSVLCPNCDDGDTCVDVTVSPDEIEEIVGPCGHEEALWRDTAFRDVVWKAVAEKEMDLYEADCESRGDRLRDGGD